MPLLPLLKLVKPNVFRPSFSTQQINAADPWASLTLAHRSADLHVSALIRISSNNKENNKMSNKTTDFFEHYKSTVNFDTNQKITLFVVSILTAIIIVSILNPFFDMPDYAFIGLVILTLFFTRKTFDLPREQMLLEMRTPFRPILSIKNKYQVLKPSLEERSKYPWIRILYISSFIGSIMFLLCIYFFFFSAFAFFALAIIKGE